MLLFFLLSWPVAGAAVAVEPAVAGAAGAEPGIVCKGQRGLDGRCFPPRLSTVGAITAGRTVAESAAAPPAVASGSRRRCLPGPHLVSGGGALHDQGCHAAAAAAACFPLPRENGEAETAALGAAQGVPRRSLPALSAPGQGKRRLSGCQSGIVLPFQSQVKAADRTGAVFQLQSAHAALHRLRQLLSGTRLARV